VLPHGHWKSFPASIPIAARRGEDSGPYLSEITFGNRSNFLSGLPWEAFHRREVIAILFDQSMKLR
jgi:hypothetical protein